MAENKGEFGKKIYLCLKIKVLREGLSLIQNPGIRARVFHFNRPCSRLAITSMKFHSLKGFQLFSGQFKP